MFDGSGGILLIDAVRHGVIGIMPGIAALWGALKSRDDAMAYRIYFPICALVGSKNSAELEEQIKGVRTLFSAQADQRGLFSRQLHSAATAVISWIFISPVLPTYRSCSEVVSRPGEGALCPWLACPRERLLR